MSKADNKQLEEAIKRLEHIDRYYNCNNYYSKYDLDCIETVLKELERLQEENKDLKQANREKANKVIEITDLYMKSVSKDQIREKIENEKINISGLEVITVEDLKELLEGK